MPSPVEQIKQRLDLVDVIQSYVKLQKVGANFKACCPFHHEKTPSFYVSPSRNIWHCFGGCGKGGDIFTFIMEIEKCEFPEALKILAQKAGIELKKEDPRLRSEKNRLLNVLEDSKKFYQKNLLANEKVLNYLTKERGLKKETIREFELGYAPGPPISGWREAYNFLRQKGYADSEIEKAGLIIQAPSSKLQAPKYYDRFRNRIIFPINDGSARTIAFGGRIFDSVNLNFDSKSGVQNQMSDVRNPKSEPAKYINSPQTVLYDKSSILYNFDKAKIEINRKDFCALVEGYMDALMSWQAGIKNAVAASGTALTPRHINLLRRLTKNVITGFDSDEAGHSATGRGIDLLLSQGFEVKIADLKGEKDPADLIKKDEKLWGGILNQAIPIIEFQLNFLRKKYGDDKRQLIANAKNNIFPRLASLNNEMEKSFWIRKIAALTDVKEETIWQDFKNSQKKSALKNSEAGLPNSETELPKSRREHLEKRIAGLIFFSRARGLFKDKLPEIINQNLKIFSAKYQPAFQSISQGADENAIAALAPQDYKSLALEVELIYNCEECEIESEIQNLIGDFRREKIKEDLKILASEIKKISEKDKNNPLLLEKIGEFNRISKELQ